MTSDVSGYVQPTDFTVSSRFEDLTPLPASGATRLVRARRYGRLWVLKGLRAECAEMSAARAMLRKEFDIVSSLQHAGIVSVTSFEEVEGLGACIVMEWVDGTTLTQWLRGTHGLKEKLDIVRQTAEALAYLHARGVQHRDLKPSNIMVTHSGGHVKIIDFGLADTGSYAILKQPAGTVGYVAPEQAADGGADERNDLYSLGCIMDEMHLPRRYRRIVRRLKAPIGARCQSAAALLADLRTMERRAWMRAWLAAVAVLFVLALVPLLIIYRSRTTSEPRVEGAPARDSVSMQKETAAASSLAKEEKAATARDTIFLKNKNDGTALLSKSLAEACAHIDREWRAQEMNLPADTVEKSRRFMLFYNACNAYVQRLPRQLPAELSAADRRAVADSAAAYFTRRYVEPFIAPSADAPR